jgi:EpsD family peptidyl-prolyl cis-trans isomerase
MKNSIVSAVLLTFLLLAPPTFAQEAAPAPVTPATSAVPEVPPTTQTPSVSPVPANQALTDLQNSALWQAYLAAYTDLNPIINPGRDIKAMLEQLDGFEFSSETKKKLFDVFGNESPLHLKLQKLGNGNSDLSILVDSLEYQDPKTGSKAHMSALTGKVTYNKLYTKGHAIASMSSFSYDDGKTMKGTAKDFSFVSDQKLGSYGLWFGTGAFKLDQLAIDDSTHDLHLKVDGMSIKSDVKQHGKLLDLGFDYVVKSINWGNDGVGPVHLAARVVNIDEKEFAAITEKSNKLNQAKQTNEERVAAASSILKDFGLATLKHGGALDIQDFSVQYHGMTAGLNGRVSFDKIQNSDLESPKLIANKITARINLHIPTVLVAEISRIFSRSNLEAQSKKTGQPVTDEAVEEMAKANVSKMTEKMLKNKWIRIEHGTIYSTIEFKTGKLFVNGQPVALPQDSSAQSNPKIIDSSQGSNIANEPKKTLAEGSSNPDTVVARVNGTSITAGWLDQAYAAERNNIQLKDWQRSPTKRALLEKLIDQMLLYQKAVELTLDQQPNVPKAPWLDRFRQVLQNYFERLKFVISPPNSEEVSHYFNEHPALFTNRRSFHFEETSVAATPEQSAMIEGKLSQASTPTAVKEILNGGNMSFRSSIVDLLSEQLPLDHLDQYAAMKDGQVTITNNSSGFTVLQLIHSELKSVTLEQTSPTIERFLFNKRVNDYIANQVKTQRATAKIEYFGEFSASP